MVDMKNILMSIIKKTIAQTLAKINVEDFYKFILKTVDEFLESKGIDIIDDKLHE